ncbi:MAG: DUF3068 domain-containing protein [Corynebacterium casei]|uniref:DUF3068 domain-containing protein n=2 Tax=Corynebacterium casei TaxID=160386 RepID=G7HZY9_9CORY|nr:DUF3068 domain-containing protein [Corynebacterium casei]AHI19117.1 hypothetical protein CCASEI_02670 [Corynebacterium casei LMG S-19264]MDN5706148.1 DUF3068 domain-containing protein [Corynebacterium casei]MDN5798731.1 DUF3068 domain-containing protein [Corynebacterium casei]MDN5826246.1 DUF3068 domain-containing protein [Corynebacterium casei]MDN5840437.1 DUF3068 domain-containing protein [Corynebacterium casei]
MLPKSRVISIVLLGLGVALLVAGIVAPQFLHSSARLPLDLTGATYTLTDDNGTAQEISEEGTEEYNGVVTYQMHVDIQDPADEQNATVSIGESTFRGEGEDDAIENLVQAQIWSYTVDRVTGEATSEADISYQLASPMATSAVDGYWFKFPSNAEKTTYPAFDPTLRQARDAVFEEELDMEGRTVYRYHQEIEPVNVATLYAGAFNTTQLETEEGGTEAGYLFHSGTRDLYVDQETGLLVGMDVDIHDYYADREGNADHDALVLNASSTEEDRAAMLAQAADIPRESTARTVRLSLLIAGGIIILLGLIGTFWPRRRA